MIRKKLETIIGTLQNIVEELDTPVASGEQPEWTDLRTVLPYNPNPDNSIWPGGNDWARVAVKDGITIHHVGSEGGTPRSTAAWITRPRSKGGKGLPRTQYHFWVARSGALYYCLDINYGQWHDHCGYPNSHISVVLEGRLNTKHPTEKQLAKLAQLVRWLMEEYTLSPDMVKGHSDLAQTACPGWIQWKDRFYDMITMLPSSYHLKTIQPFSIPDTMDP